MTSNDPLRALLCAPSGAVHDALVGLVADSEHLSVCASVDGGQDIEVRCREIKPDVLILDESLVGSSAERIARKLALERPMPILLVVDQEVDESSAEDLKLSRALRIHRLSRSRLTSGSSVDQSHASTRLNLLAARAKEGKQTMSRDDMQGILDELLEEDADFAIGPETRDLVSQPLNLIVLVGGQGSAALVEEAIRTVARILVPVLVAVDEDRSSLASLQQAANERGIPFSVCDESVRIKRTAGLVCATRERWVEIREDAIVSLETTVPLDCAQVLGSAAENSEHTVFIALPNTSATARHTLTNLARRDLLVGTCGGDFEIDAVPVMTATDLGWLFSHAVPRRV